MSLDFSSFGSLFARNGNATALVADSIVPETSTPSVSHEELVMRVNVLAQEVSRLSRELSSARSALGAGQVATNGPIPASAAEIASGRSGMRYIATRVGRNEDSVRKTLTDSPQFADLREQAPDITTNVPIIRWLASPARGTTELRYALILGGFNTVQELVREGRQ